MENFTKFYTTKRYLRIGRCLGIISGWSENGNLRTEVFSFYENVSSKFVQGEEFAYTIKSDDWAAVVEFYQAEDMTEGSDLLSTFVKEYGYEALLKCSYNFLSNECEKLGVYDFSPIEFLEKDRYENIVLSIWKIKRRDLGLYDRIKAKTNSPALKEIIRKVDKIGNIIDPSNEFD